MPSGCVFRLLSQVAHNSSTACCSVWRACRACEPRLRGLPVGEAPLVRVARPPAAAGARPGLARRGTRTRTRTRRDGRPGRAGPGRRRAGGRAPRGQRHGAELGPGGNSVGGLGLTPRRDQTDRLTDRPPGSLPGASCPCPHVAPACSTPQQHRHHRRPLELSHWAAFRALRGAARRFLTCTPYPPGDSCTARPGTRSPRPRRGRRNQVIFITCAVHICHLYYTELHLH